MLTPKLGLEIGVKESACSEPNFLPRSRVRVFSIRHKTIHSLIMADLAICSKSEWCKLPLSVRIGLCPMGTIYAIDSVSPL